MAINKTVNEIQMQAYGAMQHTLRKMTKEENDRYAAPGTEGYERHQARVKAAADRKAYRDKALAKFVKENKMVVGNLRGLTMEQMETLRAAELDYGRRLKAFKAELDKNYPLIEVSR